MAKTKTPPKKVIEGAKAMRRWQDEKPKTAKKATKKKSK